MKKNTLAIFRILAKFLFIHWVLIRKELLSISEMENEIYELENLLKKHKNDSERTLENTRSKLSRQMTFNKSKADEKHKEAQVKLDETEGHLSEKVKSNKFFLLITQNNFTKLI